MKIWTFLWIFLPHISGKSIVCWEIKKKVMYRAFEKIRKNIYGFKSCEWFKRFFCLSGIYCAGRFVFWDFFHKFRKFQFNILEVQVINGLTKSISRKKGIGSIDNLFNCSFSSLATSARVISNKTNYQSKWMNKIEQLNCVSCKSLTINSNECAFKYQTMPPKNIVTIRLNCTWKLLCGSNF